MSAQIQTESTPTAPIQAEQARDILNQGFELKPGLKVKNRIFKSAMSEALATPLGAPTHDHVNLYGAWAKGGTGLVTTGNIMIDQRALGEPGNVVIENDKHLSILKKWAQAGTQNGTQLWAQLNHPGKQAPKGLNNETVAPSAVPFEAHMQQFFAVPRALKHDEIINLITRFGKAAGIAKQAGFSGVQIHAAHGYLVNQFLSPHHNQRTDQWGGSIENRMSFVLKVYQAMRDEVGNDFPVGIKLNSADFQKGGFTEDESLQVISALSEAGIDLIEVSGGNYESPMMMLGSEMKESTKKRESYFLEFAERVREKSKVPLVVTGGFRSVTGMGQALSDDSLDLVGIARPLALDPEFSNKLLNGKIEQSNIAVLKTGIKMVDSTGIMETGWYARQMGRIAKGKAPTPNESKKLAFVKIMLGNGMRTFKYRRLRA